MENGERTKKGGMRKEKIMMKKGNKGGEGWKWRKDEGRREEGVDNDEGRV